MKGIDAVAQAVKRIFRAQRTLASHGRERFGDFHFKLARELQQPLEVLYLSAAKGAKAKTEHAEQFASLARQRALEVAREINLTTGDWVIEGRDDDVVFGDERVVRIATTEAAHAINAGVTLVSASKGGKVVWRCRHRGNDPCRTCRKLDGRRIKAGGTFVVVGGRAVQHPPLHPHCLVGSTLVTSPGTLRTMKAFYDGPVFTIVFKTGDRVTCTPNHKFLTRTGFSAAQSLVKGDDVVCCPVREFSVPVGVPYDDERPTRIEDLVASFSEPLGVTTTSVPTSAEYLHGDAKFCQGEIDVVDADGLLGNDLDAESVDEFLSKPSFVRSLLSRGLYRRGSSELMAKRLLLASDSVMGCPSIGLVLLRRDASRPVRSRFEDVPAIDPLVLQDSFDDGSGRVPFFGEGVLGLAEKITTTEIVDVKKDSFAGHVYDLQTVTGSYVVGKGIISSNCYCGLEVV